MENVISRLLKRPCTITHRGVSATINRYGDEIPAETTTEALCDLQQVHGLGSGVGARQGESGEGQVQETTFTLYLEPDVPLGGADAVEIDGEGYQVVGRPNVLHNPRTGFPHHIEAKLRRVAGAEETA